MKRILYHIAITLNLIHQYIHHTIGHDKYYIRETPIHKAIISLIYYTIT